MRFLRFLKIFFTVVRFGLDELVLSGINDRRVRWLMRVTTFGRKFEVPRGVRLRLALESLGPIFVKFGQVLSTRRDRFPSISRTNSQSCRIRSRHLIRA